MKNVLIVDNKNRVCHILRDRFSEDEMKISCISIDSDVSDFGNKNKPHLIVTVFNSKEFNQSEFDFVISIKKHFTRVPTLLIVASLKFPEFIPLFDLGVDCILSGYSSNTEILKEVEKILLTVY